MRDSSIEPLKKQMHEAELEVDAIECKIQFADLKNTYPDEYNAMRTEQEQHRQHALKAKALIDDQVKAMKSAESENEVHDEDFNPKIGSEDLESGEPERSNRLHEGTTVIKPLLIAIVAAAVAMFAGSVGAQSTLAAVQRQTSQPKQKQKVSKQKPSVIKASKTQNKKSRSQQNTAYAAAYRSGLPHSKIPTSPK